ncbi:MAG: IPT/TIG domain-containing protein [Solirubrobacteraceae bacterium]
MGRQGGSTWRRLALCLAASALVIGAGAATPAGAGAEQSATASLEGLAELSPGTHSPRERHESKRARKGIALTPSATEAHWACPEESCEEIIDPSPEPVVVGGVKRFRLPAGGPLLEGSGEMGGFDPQDLQSAYKIPTSGGETQTIALVDAYGYPTAEEDLAKYRERYGLPPCTKANGCFKKVNQEGEEGHYPPDKQGWETESALDIEMASAACPHCHIMLAEANSAFGEDLRETVDTAARLGATEISNSYGSFEQFCGEECEAEAPSYDHPGVLITASAGDGGYDNYERGGDSPNFPADLPSVVAVGGTVLRRADNARGWTEEVWSGGGSGCAKLWPKSIWQTDTGCSMRMSDDVAAVAACESPVSTYATGQKGWEDVCGTSVSSPLVSGIEAHATEYSRSLPGADAFYQDPEALFDVAAGSNGTCTPPATDSYYCHAEVGYDGPTGNGSPDGPLELTSAPAPIAATSPASGVANGEATLNGKVDPQGLEATYHFEYGTTTAYGTSLPVPDASAGSGRTAVAVSASISGLQADTTYHYRLVATNTNGTSYSSDGAFRTALPAVTSVASDFGPTDGGASVTITGENFTGATAVHFGSREAEYFTLNSAESITAFTPQGAGTVDVTVTTPAGTSETSTQDRYAYDTVGPVLSWGYNDGLLGDGAISQSGVPVEVSELPEAVDLAAGGTQSLALMPNGTVMAWGENTLGSVGNGTEHSIDVPAQVCAAATKPQDAEAECPHGPFLQEVTQVAAGSFNSLALLKNGTVVAWGGNGRGQLGIDSESESSDVPVPVCAAKESPCSPANYLKEVVSIAAGERFSLALLKNGTVMAWGENNEGELATGKDTGPETCLSKTIHCSKVPRAITGLSDVTAIAAGSYHVLALRSDGGVLAWGSDGEGELGDGATEQSDTPTAVCAAGELHPCTHDLSGVRAIAADLYTSAALLEDGHVVDWGSNYHGQLGDGSLSGPETCGSESCSRSPVAVSGLSDVSALTSGAENTENTVVTDAGEILTWGGDSYGQLGDGLFTSSDVPVRVCPAFASAPCPDGPYLSGEVLAISAGGLHNLVSLRTALSAITGVSPNRGPGAGGTKVTIQGHGLGDVTAVHFGANAASSFEILSDSELTATSPSGSGVVDITVTTPEGASHVSQADQFTYEASSVTGVSPATGPAAGGTRVTITGARLSGASAVDFGATAASEYEVRSPSEIVAVAPPGSGVANITITTPEGTSAVTPADQFVYQSAPVVVTEPAGAVRLSSATLEASVDPEGAIVTSCRFEYGTSTEYGSSAPCLTGPGSGSSPVPVSAQLTELSAATSYHFRIVATNAQGTSYGADLTFATPASEFPEVGRCLKLKKPTGTFTNSSCTTAGAGKDEWQRGAGQHNHFTGVISSVSFASRGKGPFPVLQCGESRLSGEYTGTQGASLQLTLSGCHSQLANASCQSEGAEAGIITASLHAQLGLIPGTKKASLGWQLQPASGNDLLSFICGSYEVAIAGSVIGPVSKVDKMASVFSLAFATNKEGEQEPTSFAGGSPDRLELIVGKEELGLTLTASATLDGEEPLELKAIS